MLQGIVVRAMGGFYDVRTGSGDVYRCRARGRFKKEGTDLYVGDTVRIQPFAGGEGVVDDVEPRKSLLVRPPVANVDQVVIVCSPQDPPLSLQLLDRLLVLAENQHLQAVICMNKDDLPHDPEEEYLRGLYESAGYRLILTSAKECRGIEELQAELKDKISVLAGPSGVGKSTLLNRAQPGLQLRTGDISERLKRGRHTTRHVELLVLDFGGLVADSPGFSQLDLDDVSAEVLPECFPEFLPYAEHCRFKGCKHRGEPDCAVKEARETGGIAGSRYENYLTFLREIELRERSY